MISSSAANGSSIRRISGSVTSARASDTRIFMPPDNSRGKASAKSARPTLTSASSTRARPSAFGTPPSFNGNRTFSRTLVQGIKVGSWNTKPMPWPTCAGPS
ncbi:hypothetical protein ACVWYH_004211 [Bradyrhizobium sp. GM24.11]